jgi:ABC-type branched-subunit amino acid transport system ATPase component
VVLHFGRVLVDGSPDMAMRDPEVVAAYLGTHGG